MRRWTERELGMLRSLCRDGLPYSHIASTLDRTRKAIELAANARGWSNGIIGLPSELRRPSRFPLVKRREKLRPRICPICTKILKISRRRIEHIRNRLHYSVTRRQYYCGACQIVVVLHRRHKV